ncbi:MAG: hypothetical protein AB7I36_00140 [Rhodospirillaceae bacterium]
MVAVSRSSHFHRFTVHCSEFQALGRILKTAFYARAEPAWEFTRAAERASFKIDLVLGGLSSTSAESFAAQVKRLPAVTKVTWAGLKACGLGAGS